MVSSKPCRCSRGTVEKERRRERAKRWPVSGPGSRMNADSAQGSCAELRMKSWTPHELFGQPNFYAVQRTDAVLVLRYLLTVACIHPPGNSSGRAA